MQHKIEIPEGCKATFSNENGCLIIEVEPKVKPKVEPVTFKAGDVLVNEYEGNRIIIFIPENDFIGMPQELGCICDIGTSGGFYINAIIGDLDYIKTRHATLEERKQLFDRIEAEGYEYNVKTNTIEKLRWKPKIGEIYYTPVTTSEEYWNSIGYEELRYSLGLVFKTKSESDAAAEKIKQIFAK